MPAQAFAGRQLRGLLQIAKRQQLAAQRVFQRQQAGAGEMRIVGLDGRFNLAEVQRAIKLVTQWLRLHTAKHRRAAAFPAVAMCLLPDDVLVAALAMRKNGAQGALRTSGHEQRCLKTQHGGDFFLQRIDAWVATKHIVAQRR